MYIETLVIKQPTDLNIDLTLLPVFRKGRKRKNWVPVSSKVTTKDNPTSGCRSEIFRLCFLFLILISFLQIFPLAVALTNWKIENVRKPSPLVKLSSSISGEKNDFRSACKLKRERKQEALE